MKRILLPLLVVGLTTGSGPAEAWYGWWRPYYDYNAIYYAPPVYIDNSINAGHDVYINTARPVSKRPAAKPQCQQRTICENNVCQPATICPR